MSDTSQGPGWWQASDGKWYAPELYPKDWPVPNPAGDETDATEAATDSVGAQTTLAEPEPRVAEASAQTVADAAPESAASNGTAPFGGADVTVEVEAATTAPALDATAVQPRVPAVEETGSIWDTPPAADTAASAAPSTVAPDAEPTAPPTTWHEAPPVATTTFTPDSATEDEVVSGDMPGGILGVLGGGALVAGSFLPWATAVGPGISGEINGLTGSNGWGTLITGLIVAICAALALAGHRKAWVGGAMLAASLVAIGLAVFSLVDINNTSDDLPATLLDGGVIPEIANASSLDLDTGLWIVLAGGAASLLASLMVLARRSS